MASPVCLLQRAQVILVLSHIAIPVFREMSAILCFPGTFFLTGSRAELACASLCLGTLSLARFSLNSSENSSKTGNGFPRALIYKVFEFWAGSGDRSPSACSSHSYFVLLLDALKIFHSPEITMLET